MNADSPKAYNSAECYLSVVPGSWRCAKCGGGAPGDLGQGHVCERAAPTPEQRKRWVETIRDVAGQVDGWAGVVSPRSAAEMRADAAQLRAAADFLEGGGR